MVLKVISTFPPTSPSIFLSALTEPQHHNYDLCKTQKEKKNIVSILGVQGVGKSTGMHAGDSSQSCRGKIKTKHCYSIDLRSQSMSTLKKKTSLPKLETTPNKPIQ
jgi:hypothetical protein